VATKRAKQALREWQQSAQIDLPDWCESGEIDTYYYLRTEQCGIELRTLTVHDTDTGAPVGTMEFFVRHHVIAHADSPSFAQLVEFKPLYTQGFAHGSTILGGATCTNLCNTQVFKFPPKLLTNSNSAEAEVVYQSTVGAGAFVTSAMEVQYFFTNPSWDGPSNVAVVEPAVPVRCDNATPGARSAGCVFADYEPAWDVASTGRSTFINHMQWAYAAGMRGFYPDRPPLTRLTNEALKDRNGDTACPESYPRPSTHSCDEYPFRSTHQGAFTGGGTGRTFSFCQIAVLPQGVSGLNGWSACMILRGENSSAGGFLQGFYVRNRVIEGDRFYTWV
jgi:hypothetical protein